MAHDPWIELNAADFSISGLLLRFYLKFNQREPNENSAGACKNMPSEVISLANSSLCSAMINSCRPRVSVFNGFPSALTTISGMRSSGDLKKNPISSFETFIPVNPASANNCSHYSDLVKLSMGIEAGSSPWRRNR